MSHDTKCYELAAYFLSDHEDLNDEVHRQELAETIQQAIEEWLSD